MPNLLRRIAVKIFYNLAILAQVAVDNVSQGSCLKTAVTVKDDYANPV